MTIQVLLSSFGVSFILGTLFGICTSNRLRISILTPIISGITFILRAVPFYVQLLIIYFVLPDLIGFNLQPFPASVIALGLCSSGYVSQIIRAGLNAVPLSQWETAQTLGYTTYQTLRYIIFPQTLLHILPPLNNELDNLLKSTAIVSSIGMLELTRVGMNIVSRTMEPVPVYLTIALFYVVMSALLNLLARTIEKKVSYVRS